jgi:hypothetical protein
MKTLKIKDYHIELAKIIGSMVDQKFKSKPKINKNGLTNNQMSKLAELTILDTFKNPKYIGFYHESNPLFDWDIFADGVSYDVKSSCDKCFNISKKIIDENRDIDKFILVYMPTTDICQYKIVNFSDVKKWTPRTIESRPNEPFYSKSF